ncbi:hypothetical protein BSKO_05059 [Bryopsis sp. KO-2023]|nr:hypothetical protein BSKO_05059 [Bryopsis sp. KO-2023]
MTILNASPGQTVHLECHGRGISLTVNEHTDYTGTALWDSAIILAKCMEHFFPIEASKSSPHHQQTHSGGNDTALKGKRAIELGAGTGLAGIACALCNCDVVLTDVQEVLPALRASVARNLGKKDEIQVKELKWGNDSHVQATEPPFDLILAADCVFSMELVEPFVGTIVQAMAPSGVALIAVEIRSRSVSAEFIQQASQFFDMRKIPLEVLGGAYLHPALAVWCLTFSMEDPWWDVIRRWPVCNPQQQIKALDNQMVEVVLADPPRLVETAQLKTHPHSDRRKADESDAKPTYLRKISSWGTYGGTGKFGTFC